MTASAIARQLAPRTKNMVIGRARRIGLPHRVSPVVRVEGAEPRREKAARRKASREVAEGVTLAATVVTPPVVRFSRCMECQWPVGEPGTRGFRFCGEPAEEGKPYCLSHCRIAFVRLGQKKEEVVA